MNFRIGRALCALALAALTSVSLAQQSAPTTASGTRTPAPTTTTGPPGDPGRFEVDTLGPGIYLFRPNTVSRRYANSVVFVRDDGLLVVDGQPTEQAARDLLAAIRLRSAAPIRYLVLTHPHAPASGGSAAFPADTLRIATVGFRDAVADPDFRYESELYEESGDEGFEPPEEIARPRVTLVLFDRTRLEDERNPVILMPLPPSHSPGDLLVYQAEAGVVVAGHIVFPDGAPYAGDANVGRWIGQLNHLVSMSPRWVVGGRGKAIQADRVRAQQEAFAWLRGKVDQGFAEALDPDEIPDFVRGAERFSRYFRPSAPFVDQLIEKVIEEARERRRKIGLE